jgi:hypothetical protein
VTHLCDDTLAFDQLLESIERVGDPPCKECPLREHCASEPAACLAFLMWVENGKAPEGGRNPSRDIYDFMSNVAPLNVPAELTHQRNQVLAALLVEATNPGHPMLLCNGVDDERIKAYCKWLASEGVTVSLGAMGRLVARYR